MIEDWTRFGGDAPARDMEPTHAICHGHGMDADGWPVRDAEDMALLHSGHPDLVHVTGRTPYEFVIPPEGGVQQALPLSVYGCHAMGWSRRSIGIALLYRRRTDRPQVAQLRSLYWLCNLLVGEYGLEVLGHSEAHAVGLEMVPPRPATKTAAKLLGGPEQCPPPAYDLGEMRRHAYAGSCVAGGELEAAGAVM